ncbi:MAG TPA: phosphatase PAP2 family protein [candidate division Zixibacteria bacterium]|nr:phosphatase PAP2 family protein [candidate division Zixibacteria bacterium]
MTRIDRIRKHLGCKLALALGLNLWALVPYYALQHHTFFPVTLMPETPVDEWIGFDDRALWLYLSLFLLMPVAPLQMTDLTRLRRYAVGVCLLSLAADLVFLVWPTAVRRPDPGAASAFYVQLTQAVSPRNACPSLHAAMAIFSALCYEQTAADFRHPGSWRIALWAWALAILYATLAVKEHVLLDVLAGSLLGWAAYWLAFRASPAAKNLDQGRTKP